MTTPTTKEEPKGVIDPVPPTSATRADIEDDWPVDRFVLCRVAGHQWHHHRPRTEGRLALSASTCSNCGTTRSKTMNEEGDNLRTKYQYRDGYLTKTKRKAKDYRARFVANTLGELG